MMFEEEGKPASELRFEVELAHAAGLVADAVLGDTVFEVLSETREASRFQTAILRLARLVACHEAREGFLILDRPAFTRERISTEWLAAGAVLKEGIFARLKLAVAPEDKPLSVAWGNVSKAEGEAALRVIAQHRRRLASGGGQGPRHAFFDVLRVLLVHWFRSTGPLTSKRLCEQCGVTYPTLAAALARLEPQLRRGSDRRIELRSFPMDAWLRLTSQADEIRRSRSYTDRSGQPRPPELLLERLRALAPVGVAVGGVAAARHYLPGLDLVGTPRLDLIVHVDHPASATSLLRRLDAGLKPAVRGEPARVVVHQLSRPAALFVQVDGRLPWADEVECVLDLFAARLLPQAGELLAYLESRTLKS